MIDATLAHAMTKAAIETYETVAEQKAKQLLTVDLFSSVENAIRAAADQMRYYTHFELVIPSSLTTFESKIQETFTRHLEKLGYTVRLFHSECREKETTLLYDIRWVK